ncbi:MAG: hypothetical protein ACOC6R_01690 [Chloroflexota bacterium]
MIRNSRLCDNCNSESDEGKYLPCLDSWFDYPPDWEIRRKKVVERDGYRCT